MRNLLLVLLANLMLLAGCKNKEENMYQAPTSIELNNTDTNLLPIAQSMANGDSLTVVCYGNSITYGGVDTPYPEALQQLWQDHYQNPNIVVHNQGHPGWTAEMANGGLDTLVLPYQPDMVTLIFGINDLVLELGTDNFAYNMQSMIQRLKAQGITVLVMSPTPLAFELNLPLLDYCNKAAEVADTEQVAFFHMHGAMVQHFDSTHADVHALMPDLVHFEQEGYLMIADRLYNWWQTIE